MWNGKIVENYKEIGNRFKFYSKVNSIYHVNLLLVSTHKICTIPQHLYVHTYIYICGVHLLLTDELCFLHNVQLETRGIIYIYICFHAYFSLSQRKLNKLKRNVFFFIQFYLFINK